MNRLLIVDGHAYAYRAFYAIRNLRGPGGQPTNAIYGFIKMLEKMREALDPASVSVVWDGGLSAERLAAHPQYKMQRPEMPDELRLQLNEIVEYLVAAGVFTVLPEQVEADDYIACLARKAAAGGWTVVIASSDKDFMQLVSPKVGLWNPNDKTAVVWSRDQVLAKTGVEPAQVADWLALMGDAVDNIPGVPGVGPKTAADLLRQFGSVAGLYGRLAEVKSDRLRAALTGAEELVKKNIRLVQLHEVPCQFEPEKLAVKPADRGRLRALFQRWGFKGMTEDLDRVCSGEQAELI